VYHLGIEVFIVIVHTQNLSKAAEQLNLAQSTVSKRLQLLEQELGVVLIDRGKGNKALQLTAAGKSFLDLAIRWQSLFREMQNFHTNTPQLTLSIGAVLSLNYIFLPSLCSALHKHQPPLKIKVQVERTQTLYDLIERRDIDVAFIILEQERHQIITEKYFSDPMVGLCRKNSDYAQAKIIHPSELDVNHEIYIFWGHLYQSWHDHWWSQPYLQRVQLNTSPLIHAFLSTNLHWTIIPLSLAKNLQRTGDYHIFYLSDSPPDRTYYKITHKYPKSDTIKSLEILEYYLESIKQDLLMFKEQPCRTMRQGKR
jgi:DNA-binding transcriptional LysR family regulator